MKGDPDVIDYLNRILCNELTAVNQYFLHSRMAQNWGYHAFAAHEYKESLEEMRHADELMQRILTLEGAPNIQALGSLSVGQTIPKMLASDLQLEQTARLTLVAAIQCCENKQDYVSRDLCQSILSAEEKHIDWLEMQAQIVDKIGEANYLQSQLGTSDN